LHGRPADSQQPGGESTKKRPSLKSPDIISIVWKALTNPQRRIARFIGIGLILIAAAKPVVYSTYSVIGFVEYKMRTNAMQPVLEWSKEVQDQGSSASEA